MSDYNYFLSFFSSETLVAGFSSVLLSGLIIPFTVSPIGSLSNTPRLGATVFTNVFQEIASSTVSSVEYSDISQVHVFERLYLFAGDFLPLVYHLILIAIAGFDSAALTIASKPSASASNTTVSYLPLLLPVSFG